MKFSLLLIPAVLLPFQAINAVSDKDTLPFVFKAGDTARAAAVNGNFSFMLSRMLKAESAIDSLSAALTASQLAKGTVAAFLTKPGSDGYLEGSNQTWLLAAGQGDVNGVTVPDMRGRFLRGIYFTVNGCSLANHDPDGVRSPGTPQNDAIQEHTHYTAIQEAAGSGGGIGYTVAADYRRAWAKDFPTSGPMPDTITNSPAPRTANETRPKNVAVYWYIKVK